VPTRYREEETYKRSCQPNLEKAPRLLDLQDKSGHSALMLAADSSEPEIANYLIECGADLKLKDEKGWKTKNYLKECVVMMQILPKNDPRLVHAEVMKTKYLSKYNFNC
jgi:hypothetical protein